MTVCNTLDAQMDADGVAGALAWLDGITAGERRLSVIRMSEITLTFTVPDKLRPVFDHELDLALDAMEPMREWLTRHGGSSDLTSANHGNCR
jgi:hypothetical protein